MIRSLIRGGMMRPAITGMLQVPAENTTIDLSIEVDAGNSSIQATYTFNVANNGDSVLTDVVAEVTIDSSLTFVSGSGPGWSVSSNGKVVTYTRAAIGAGVTRSFTLIVSTTTTGNLTTIIGLTADNSHAHPGEPLQVSISNSLTSAFAGAIAISSAPLSYNVYAENTGLRDARDVELSVALASGLSFVSGSGNGWSVSHLAGVVTCTRDTLAPGAILPIVIDVVTDNAASTKVSTVDATAENVPAIAQASVSIDVELVDLDATSGKRIPSSLQQITDLFNYHGIPTVWLPTHGYLFDQPSGSFVDFIGNKNLAVTGTPTRGKAVTGWTKTSVAASGAAANQYAENATVANVSTDSIFVLAYLVISAPTTTANHQRLFHGTASVNALEAVLNTTTIRLRNGASSGNGALAHSGVHPIGIQHSVNALPNEGNVSRILTDLEAVSVAYAASASSSTLRVTFGLSTDITANTEALYMLDWEGAPAEMQSTVIRAIYEALGFTVTGGWGV